MMLVRADVEACLWLSVVHLKRTGMYIYPYEIV